MIRPGDTILFLGDSITDAFRKPEELNLSFQLGAGYAFLAAAGILLDYPEAGYKFLNAGVIGDTLIRLQARWQRDCIDRRPDVVSILAGVNDTLNAVPHAETERNYRALLEWTFRDLQGVRVIILEPFLLPCGEITAEKVADITLRQVVVSDLAREFGAVYVPLQRPFEAAAFWGGAEHYSYDGIHASPAGAALIARAWRHAALGERNPSFS